MAADYINVNRSKQPGNNLVRAADMLAELRNLVAKIYASGNHMNDGVDYSLFEADFGLAAGSGANTLTLIGLLNDTINASVDKTGAVRLAQLDEFCARLAGQ